MLLFISAIILFALILSVLVISAFSDDYDSRVFGFTLSLIILIPFILILIQYQQPTAMDVYEGKTTLEITYKDGVPVDSTVVWKSK